MLCCKLDVDIFGYLVRNIGCVHNFLYCVCYVISLPCLCCCYGPQHNTSTLRGKFCVLVRVLRLGHTSTFCCSNQLIFPETPNLIFNEYYFFCCLLSGLVIKQHNYHHPLVSKYSCKELPDFSCTHTGLLKIAIKEKGLLVDEEDTNKK